MKREQVELALIAALDGDEFYPPGYGWPRDEMASVAFRRWHSFSRRNKSKHPSDGDRILDLAKGLQDYFDLIHHDCKLDYIHHAKIMAPILKGGEIDAPPNSALRDF